MATGGGKQPPFRAARARRTVRPPPRDGKEGPFHCTGACPSSCAGVVRWGRGGRSHCMRVCDDGAPTPPRGDGVPSHHRAPGVGMEHPPPPHRRTGFQIGSTIEPHHQHTTPCPRTRPWLSDPPRGGGQASRGRPPSATSEKIPAAKNNIHQRGRKFEADFRYINSFWPLPPPPPPPCDIPAGCCLLTGPWTVTRSSLRMLRRVAAFCRPLRPVLLLVSFPRSRSPVVGVPGLCWMWRDVPFARQRRPIIGVLGVVLVVAGVV